MQVMTREREREREKEGRERERGRERGRERERERERDGWMDGREGGREGGRERDRQRQRQKDRQRDRQSRRDRETKGKERERETQECMPKEPCKRATHTHTHTHLLMCVCVCVCQRSPVKEPVGLRRPADVRIPQGVHLARRSSGGGAVYQDLGNTNFTFLSSTDNFDKIRNSGIIIDALGKWGLRATTSGRNDIVVGPDDAPLKVSGAAYKLSPPRALHHGTLLIDVNIGALSSLLNPNKLKLQSKGVSSVAARVTNLKKLDEGITHETLSEEVIAAFCRHYSSVPVTPQTLDHSFLQQQDDLRVRRRRCAHVCVCVCVCV